MPIRADDPLRKVTLNLYETDCTWLEQTYGHGWTERVRQHIRNEVHARRSNITAPRKTLGDLDE